MPDFPAPSQVSPLPQYLQVSALLIFDVLPVPFGIRDLHFDWKVTKRIGPEPDEAVVNIYNMAPLRIEALNLNFSDQLTTLAVRGAAASQLGQFAVPPPPDPTQFGTVNLLVGWQGKPDLLFAGNMVEWVAEQYTGVDTVSTLVLRDGGIALRDAPAPGGSLSVATAFTILGTMALALGLQVAPAAQAVVAAKAAELPLQVFNIDIDGVTARTVIDDLMATLNLSWAPIKGFVVVFDGGVRNELLPVRIGPGTGLLDYTRIDDGGYKVTALGQAALEPGGRVFVLNEKFMLLGNAPMWCQSIEFSGDNDGNHVMTFEMRKLDLVGQAPSVGFV